MPNYQNWDNNENEDETLVFPKLETRIVPVAKIAKYWGQIQGLMAGIIVGHLVQYLAGDAGLLTWTNKFYVSLIGAALYSICLALLVIKDKIGLWIAVLGPIIGLSTTLILGFKPDVFQLSTGILQIWALILALALLFKKKFRLEL